MKKAFISVLMLTMFVSKAGAGGYLALGEVCFPGGTFENEGVCAPGMLCFYDLGIGYGYCMSDCSLAGDETVADDSVWNDFGGLLPFDWSGKNTAYLEARCVRASCLNSGAGCAMEYAYACATGYYGKSTNGTTGCTRCPNDGMSMVLGMGGFKVEDCFLPRGSYSDETGTYSLSEDCYYK